MHVIQLKLLLGLIVFVYGWTACTPKEEEAAEEGTSSSSTSTENKTSNETSKKIDYEANYKEMATKCREVGKSHNPRSIADSVALINALPKPTSIPCFLLALPRPMKLAAADSKLSGQPAVDRTKPRYFILYDDFFITVAGSGAGKDAVEFSEYDGNIKSVKGEIRFPVTDTIGPDAPYKPLVLPEGTGSTCATCHRSEAVAGAGYPDSAFTSMAIKPANSTLLLMFEISQLNQACQGRYQDEHCLMLMSMFDGLTPQTFDFPSSMPTFSTQPPSFSP